MKLNHLNRHKLPAVFFDNPFELAVGVILLISGSRALLDVGALPSSINTLPQYFGVTYRVSLALAGGLIMTGLLARRWGWASAVEQAGLWVASSIFAAYGIAAWIVGVSPEATIFGATVVAIAFACGFRARSLAVDQKLVGQVLRQSREGPHE